MMNPRSAPVISLNGTPTAAGGAVAPQVSGGIAPLSNGALPTGTGYVSGAGPTLPASTGSYGGLSQVSVSVPGVNASLHTPGVNVSVAAPPAAASPSTVSAVQTQIMKSLSALGLSN